ncbi:Protein mlp1 [Malassezia sp. CBS 17886]|nr:Protein mlp1 [Malassezia sp. CBS 17886]
MADLTARVAALEEEKRRLLASWQREREENARIADELDGARTQQKAVRQELSAATLALEEGQSRETTTRFKTRALEQELALSRQDAQWAREELSREHASAAETRAELHARLMHAEAERDLADQERAAAAAQLTRMERVLADTQAKHLGATDRIAELQTHAAAVEHGARADTGALERALELSEGRVRLAEERAAQLERTCDEIMAACGAREQDARAGAEAAEAEGDALRGEKDALQEALDRLARGLGIAVGGEGGDVSRTALYAANVQREGKSFSDVYVDLLRTQEELRRERAETGRLEGVLAEVVADLDAHAPQLRAQREETAGLRAELDAASAARADAEDAREAAAAHAQTAHADVDRLQRECALQAQQLDDAALQVRALTREIVLLHDPHAHARMADDGTPVDAAPRRAAGDPAGDIHSVITDELVTFRSLSELCAQNRRLLHAVRELGTQMEARDKRGATGEDASTAAVDEAAALLAELQRQLEDERTLSADLRRERDTFRDVCRGAPSHPTSTDHTPADARADERTRAELRDAQVAADSAAAARDAALERAASLERNTELARAQLADATQASAHLHALVQARERALEEKDRALVQAHSALDETRSQRASLDAEVQMRRQQVEALLEENGTASRARAAAEQAVREAQQALADRAQADSRERTRLQQEAAHATASCAALETKLADARAAANHATLRREVETRELRERMESLAQQHISAREALSAAQTNAQHLERRVDDVNAELERTRALAALLERQLAAAAEDRRAAAHAALGTGATPSADLPLERQLEMELSDVRRGRAAAEAETLAARAEAAAAAQQQAALQTTLDETNAALATANAAAEAGASEKQAAADAAAQHAQELTARADTLQAEVSALHTQLDAQQAAAATEKRELEDALAGLQSAESGVAVEQTQAWDEARKFAAATKDAEARLHAATAAHAEAETHVERLRNELQRARDESEQVRKARDLAEVQHNRAVLDAQETQRTLEGTVEALRTQLDELKDQNEQLHTHLESVSAQVAKMGGGGDWVAGGDEGVLSGEEKAGEGEEKLGSGEDMAGKHPEEHDTTDSGDGGAANNGDSNTTNKGVHATAAESPPTTVRAPPAGDLHQVIRYLRREKDVLELRQELAKHEQARLQHAADRAQAEATQLRTELATTRETPAAAPPQAPYAELLDKINQLSALREHVTTLREGKEAVEARVATLEAQLRAAQTDTQPMREQLSAAQVELEVCQGQLRVVQDDAAHWQTRAGTLLQTSGVQAELQKAEDERSAAQAQVDAVRAEAAAEQARLAEELQTANTRFEQLRQQVRERIKQERRAVTEAAERNTQLQQEKAAFETSAAEAKDALEHSAAAAKDALEKSTAEKSALEARIAELENAGTAGEKNAAGKDAGAAEATDAPLPDAAPSDTTAPALEAAAPPTDAERTAWESERTQLAGALRAKTEECEKHKNFARTFLKQKRAAEAQLDALRKEHAEGEDAPEKAEKTTENTAENAVMKTEEGSVSSLRERIAELEATLAKANARIAELEAALASPTDKSAAGLAEKQATIDRLTAELSTAKAAVPGSAEEALQAKEAELKAHYQPLLQSRYDDGKHEATLRNTIMLKQRDNKITRLTAEVAELTAKLAALADAPAADAGGGPAAQPPASTLADASTAGLPEKPAGARPAVVRGGSTAARGGAATRGRGGRAGQAAPKPVPLISKTAAAKGDSGTSIRGAAAATRGAASGRGRGGAAAGGPKRKRELGASTSESTDAGKPSKAAASPAKKTRSDEGAS